MRAAFLIQDLLLHIECVDIETTAGQAGGCAIQVHAPYAVLSVEKYKVPPTMLMASRSVELTPYFTQSDTILICIQILGILVLN